MWFRPWTSLIDFRPQTTGLQPLNKTFWHAPPPIVRLQKSRRERSVCIIADFDAPLERCSPGDRETEARHRRRRVASHVSSLATPCGVVCRRSARVVGDLVNAIWTVTGGRQDSRTAHAVIDICDAASRVDDA